MSLNILLISGHAANWDAGASTVFLHLERELRRLGHHCDLRHAEDWENRRLRGRAHQLAHRFGAAAFVERNLLAQAARAEIVEVAGNLGWRLFGTLRQKPVQTRPLLVTRLHGLEWKDEQARVDEELNLRQKLPSTYKWLSRHWVNWQEFRSLSFSDLVICHTSREADAMITSGLVTEDRVEVMPLGVDEAYLSAPSAREYRAEGTRLLWWGSWVERKGIFDLPRAFELACRQDPSLTLTLGGTGRSEADLRPLFAPQVRQKVRVLPFLSRVEHIQTLREHDIFVFPSLSEGFGLALLEAMATGLPAIATPTGLAHDWLRCGQNCLMVPMFASTSLACAILSLSRDQHLRQSLGRAAHETASGLLWSRFGARSAQVYTHHLARLHAAPQVSASP